MSKKTSTTKQPGKKIPTRTPASTMLPQPDVSPTDQTGAEGPESTEQLFKFDPDFKLPISVSMRKDGRWTYTVDFGVHATGERHRTCSTRNTEEKAWREAIRVYLAGPSALRAAAPVLTVSMLIGRIMERRGSTGEYSTQSNLAWLHQIIDQQVGQRLVSQLTSDDVHNVLTTLGETDGDGTPRYSESTQCKVYQRLCRVLDVAVHEGAVHQNVARLLDKDLRPTLSSKPWTDAWTTEDVQNVLRTAAELDPKLFPLIVLAFASGVRIGELVGARLSDYDPVNNTFRAFGTAKEGGGRGKGKNVRSHREILLPDEVQDVLKDHLERLGRLRADLGPAWGIKRVCTEETREKKRQAALKQWGRGFDQTLKPAKPVPTETHEWLFPTPRGTRDHKNNIGRRWRRILQTAGMEHRVFHTVRATCITAALEAKVPLNEIQAMVGHASPVMTLLYSHRPKQSTAAKRMAAQLGLAGILKKRKP
ncbi:hypothetical protein E7T09_01055 [Deinococcus sp. KSM4-11]|uniref:tyrosine-type recombinase/integrase n=1 Tax=Deinococcus sp. KSM4-11 TaxID=2568654 RepID=UPI0010A3BA48|nr:tyrosine-type recombinase/integrase [Deinococcus sp. KSM4-11]THF87856.1 hypothetical protein E7T09_01055 [Deinococcus sp. KSM4-11]